MRYVIYCDESRHDPNPKAPFYGIGGLWVPQERKECLTQQLRELRETVGLRGEIKWSKVSRKRLDAYRQLVDFFAKDAELKFRIILVEKAKLQHATFNQGDEELGFYKFYYEMLRQWLRPENQYLVLLDFKQNRGAGRYTDLRRSLKATLPPGAELLDLTVINSQESPLAQLADLLTGAVTAAWCGIEACSAKADLAAYIASQCQVPTLRRATSHPGLTKLNIFQIDL